MNEIEKEKRKRVTNCCFNTECKKFSEFSDEQFLEFLINSEWFSYIIFQREFSKEKGEHWQGYLELKSQRYLVQLENMLKEGFVEKRRETQQQSISYCKKTRSRIGDKYYEWGEKRKTKKICDDNIEKEKEGSFNIILNKKKLEKHLFFVVKNIKDGKYQSVEEIKEKELQIFYFHKKKLISAFNSFLIKQREKEKGLIKPAKVIWVFGKSGSGKTIWTEKYLRKNWKPEEWDYLGPSSLTFNEKITLNSDSENRKVLVLTEVDEEFPKHNNLIKLIDRKELIATEREKVVNNFELIIINSVFRPEQLYRDSKKDVVDQVFRRIWNKGGKVIEIKANEKQISIIKKRRKDMEPKRFIDWYKPIVEEIKEPNYKLIKGE